MVSLDDWDDEPAADEEPVVDHVAESVQRQTVQGQTVSGGAS